MDPYDIGAAFEAIEDELIASMIRNMKRHRVEEVSQGIQWSQWQAEQLKALEKFKKHNQKLFSGKFKEINSMIEDAIKAARQQGNMDQEMAILEAIKGGFKGARKQSRGTYGEFFRLNDRKLNALIKAATDDFKNGETAMLRQANDQYRQIIYNAQVYANTGAGTYEKAVDMATKDFLSRGITCIEYANGARHAMKDYADMAIRTAAKRAYLTGEGEKRQEWGIHTVILNKRGDNPCPKCLPFVGKVLIDDVWSNGSSADGPYPLMSHAIARGLYHPRCKDSHTTYFPGLSTADDTWTQEELDNIEWESRQEAKQQYAKRQEEKYNRLAEYSLDEENQKQYDTKKEQWKIDTERKAGAKSVEKIDKADIINSLNGKEEIQVHTVGKINRDIYMCVTEDIITDEVIVTDERIQHIKERHPNDYERFYSYLPEIITNPDYIIKANKPDTATVLKEIVDNGEKFQLVLRLVTSKDKPEFKNSIITFLKINKRTWDKYLRNKEILYKRD